MRKCVDCGEQPEENFYRHSHRSGLMSLCKSCLNKRTHKRQRDNKERAVKIFGGKCQHCGYDRCIKALEFHHIDPSNKERVRSNRLASRGWNRYFAEVQKCVLLCANCHREEEDKIFRGSVEKQDISTAF